LTPDTLALQTGIIEDFWTPSAARLGCYVTAHWLSYRDQINDRLDITGARRSLLGAEAILKLRSLKSSRDFEKYWTFYKTMSKKRNYDFC
jgi:hypothetical protein